jgi:hypothetical protein
MNVKHGAKAVSHLLVVYNSLVFILFTELRNHHHSQF